MVILRSQYYGQLPTVSVVYIQKIQFRNWKKCFQLNPIALGVLWIPLELTVVINLIN